MSNDNEIERTLLAKGNNFLKLIKRVFVVFKEFAELIPEKYDLYVILVNNILEPCFQSVGIKIPCCDSLFVRKLKNI